MANELIKPEQLLDGIDIPTDFYKALAYAIASEYDEEKMQEAYRAVGLKD